MTVETVLAGILFATLSGGGLVNIQFQVKLMLYYYYLGTYDIGVLISEVDVFNVPFQRHLMEVLMTIGALFSTVPLLLARSIR